MLVKRKIILYWMLLGLILIFLQIVIGGVTRLTGSGLSITKWEIVTGTIPPLSQESWEMAFSLYKATPQYEKINRDMSLSDFKFIYFWEYLHRLWARGMGIVFLIPFIYFLSKGWLDRRITVRLFIVALLAGLVGLFGWIMVASGLVDRPWVNAYKLSIHLCLALLVFAYLLWTLLLASYPGVRQRNSRQRIWLSFLIVVCVQIFFGGLMSGMKAALAFPTWPDMNGAMIPDVLFERSAWNVDNFVDYDNSDFMVSFVQVFHRLLAYILIVSGLYLFFLSGVWSNNRLFQFLRWMFITLLICQIVVGILVLLFSVGSVPVLYGVLHQAIAILVLCTVLCLYYFHRYEVEYK